METRKKDEYNLVPAAPKKRRGAFVPILFFILGVLSAVGYFNWKSSRHGPGAEPTMAMPAGSDGTSASAEKKPGEPKILYWVDPMNPSNRTDKPGKAPCGMDLVPVYEDAPGKKPGEAKILYWVDPMNPSNKTDKPGKAPCGMDMVPVYDDTSGSDGLPPGTVKLSPDKQQLIGVQFGEAAEIPLAKTIRAVGRAAYDETRIHHMHTRFEGYVDTVYVDFTGKLIKKGQPLISIYSPELMATQQELLVAKKSSEILQKSDFEGISSQSLSLYKATRERLKLWEISDQQIKEIERKGSPVRAITLYSHSDGFVIARNVFAGHQVKPEMELYTIADLSNVWVLAEVYEYEISNIQLGQKAQVTFPSFPGKTFTGKITYISPEIDPKTRTAKIRIEFANKDFLIKPDMFANVDLTINYGNKLSVPQEAVLDSGGSQTIFVARDGGYFEPRKVTLGQKVDNRVIVLEGIKQGEKVVISANFLIDSESQLKSATGGMSGMENMPGMKDMPKETPPAADVSSRRPGVDEESGNQVLKARDSGKPSGQTPGHAVHGGK